MAKIDVTETEQVWPGKYNEDGTLKEVPRVSLPFQVIETINESRATSEAKKGDLVKGAPNNRLQRTALRAAADAGRWAIPTQG